MFLTLIALCSIGADPTADTLAAALKVRTAPRLDLGSDCAIRTGMNEGVRNSRLLTACIDAFKKAGIGGRVTVPRGQYTFKRPCMWDAGTVWLVGEQGTSLVFPESSGLIVGLPRLNGLAPSVIGDGTAAHDGTCGKRNVLHLSNGNHLVANGSGFQAAHGNYWRGESELTFDWMFGLPDGEEADKDVGIHMGASKAGVPYPLTVTWNHLGERAFRFRTTGVTTFLYLPPGGLSRGVHKLTFQVSFKEHKAMCWLDGTAMTNIEPLPSVWPKTFSENWRIPWNTHGMGPLAVASKPDGAGGGSDYDTLALKEHQDLYGLALSAGKRYTWDDKLTRLDGNPINDLNRFYSDLWPVVAMLPMDDDPTLSAADRCFRIRGGGQSDGTYGWSTALLLSTEHNDPGCNTGQVSFQQITVSAAGDGCILGNALFLSAQDCGFFGNEGGLASWNDNANYPNRFVRCSFLGRDAPVYLYYAIARFEDAFIFSNGRVSFWAERSNVVAEHTFIGPYMAGPATHSFLRLTDGSSGDFSDTNIDVEDGSIPDDAAVVVGSSGAIAGSLGARCRLNGLTIGHLASGIPVVRLESADTAPIGWLDMFYVATSFTGVAKRPMIVVDDPTKWRIDRVTPGLDDWPQITR